MCDHFYRVAVILDDAEDPVSLEFDFPTGEFAIRFARMAYNACDICKVVIRIITNEVTTTNSPMWRSENG